ncbi:MAG: hypothetical protein ACR2OM_05165 [Aestuariivirgaceae bacterium]
MKTLAALALTTAILGAGLTAHQPDAHANGANSRNSQCLWFKQKAAFAKTAKARAKYTKLHRDCLRRG